MYTPCRLAVVGASEFNAAHFLAESYDRILAIDGGYASLVNNNIHPTWALGDFDSLGYVPSGIETEIYPVQKDASDFELALTFLYERKFSECVCYGVLDGRFDHSLASLSVLAQFALKGMKLIAVGADHVVIPLIGASYNSLTLLNQQDREFSLFAFGGNASGVSEEGMVYPLDNAELSCYTSLGLSNRIQSHMAQVTVKYGCVMALCAPDSLCQFSLSHVSLS